ncbi:hypothetical protein HK414_25210 [Ramlibacter terrae]|uniref:Uncharacterized protein n=1 Tax=Ramlibacter terrae TaxID=2732511 RepID=A0ABX6P5K3_9BURK|nr:hypothetical protein HK414_25210 [Ramlibacter terrae]
MAQRSISVITKLNTLLGLFVLALFALGGYALHLHRLAGTEGSGAVWIMGGLIAAAIAWAVVLRLTIRRASCARSARPRTWSAAWPKAT